MSYLEILILSIGLAMDAFAVSICKSSQMKADPKMKKSLWHSCLVHSSA